MTDLEDWLLALVVWAIAACVVALGMLASWAWMKRRG